MRVVLLQSVVALGGYEQHMLNLATGLRRLGHEAEIMGLLNAGGFEWLHEAAEPGIPIHFPGYWPQKPMRAWEMLAELESDVVNVQMPMPQLALETTEASVVATVHSEFSFDAVPRCDAAVCLDQRWYDATASALGVRPHRLRNGIDLQRFPCRRDVADRDGVAAWGRFDPPKLGPARAVCDSAPVDCWGDSVPLPEPGLIVKGRARPEDVCYDYRVVSATGLSALEAMACGALLLTPEPTEEGLAAWADAGFAAEVVYPPGPETDERVRQDLAGLLTLNGGAAQGRADFCREWVEREHDCVKMAEKFVNVYEAVA